MRQATANAHLAGWPQGEIRTIDEKDAYFSGLVKNGLLSLLPEPKGAKVETADVPALDVKLEK